MRTSSQHSLQRFRVDIHFFSGNDLYACETYRIDAPDWYRAEQQALQLSGESAYDNSRIPDLRRTATSSLA
ncbi:MAG: hypothetical protein PSY12_05990 [bacterium]|nr:hypothetical protein [bacterium]